MASFEKVCEYCGKEYVAQRSRSKYCSDTCRARSHHDAMTITEENMENDARQEMEHFQDLEHDLEQDEDDVEQEEDVEVTPADKEQTHVFAYFREYMSWDGKQIEEDDVLGLIEQIEDDNDEGKFSVKGKYGNIVRHIHKELNRLLTEVEEWPTDFSLDESDWKLLGDDLYAWFR